MYWRSFALARSVFSPSTSLTLHRCKHINHPGHKPKPATNPVRYDLPDRYTDEVIYPPVKPKYPPGIEWTTNGAAEKTATAAAVAVAAEVTKTEPAAYEPRLAWTYYAEGQKFHSLRTIQERLSVLAFLNVRQSLDDLKVRRTHYSPIFKLSGLPRTPGTLPFTQHITKTDVKPLERAGDVCAHFKPTGHVDHGNHFERLKHAVKEAILVHANQCVTIEENPQPPVASDTYTPEQRAYEQQTEQIAKRSGTLLKSIVNTMTSILCERDEHAHLLDALYSTDVSIKAYWKRCGFDKCRPRGAVGLDTDVIRFQFDDVAAFQIKTDKPLKPFFNLKDSACNGANVPSYAYTPAAFKLFADHLLPMQVPGHWYGDSREFNYLSVFNTTKLKRYYDNKFNDRDHLLAALRSMAVACGHAELTAQAYYLGFSMWKDLEYPLHGQYILSDGDEFSIAFYQLNTIRLWNKCDKRNNLCHITPPKRLFELNEDATGFKSFDDALFQQLINVLTYKPIAKAEDIFEHYNPIDHMVGGTRLRPYLQTQRFEEQLSVRHQLLAISLYELVKYDKTATYLNLRSDHEPVSHRPMFYKLYDKHTYDFRDIVLNYYPRDYFGLKLVDRLLKKAPKQTEKFWDLKQPVFEWANVPPPDINNVPREINLPTF